MDFQEQDISDEELFYNLICQYADSFVEQVKHAGGWPVSFTFPEPQNSSQRWAFKLFIAEVEKTTGQTVRFTTKLGSA
jgi:hypothetical protein